MGQLISEDGFEPSSPAPQAGAPAIWAASLFCGFTVYPHGVLKLSFHGFSILYPFTRNATEMLPHRIERYPRVFQTRVHTQLHQRSNFWKQYVLHKIFGFFFSNFMLQHIICTWITCLYFTISVLNFNNFIFINNNHTT